ncbi:NAD(P)-binding protein [Corynespora cassiicola Philippines]|uniref:NAD(P)-binding protein n=1 Tax=Corynespora cassiicola Philippines TaxID=1448308 RepID=A0A2T2P8S8_CORCC|nr:NAD(P)-binding protein [Corynespora cassiicola Philippines]
MSPFTSIFSYFSPATRPGQNATRKTALITGCSEGGIGAALASAFLDQGYFVFVTARNTSKVPLALKDAENVQILELDTTSLASIRAAVDAVRSSVASLSKRDGSENPQANGNADVGVGDRPGLDVLVNNAGHALSGPGLDVDVDREGKACFEVNVWGPLRMMQAFSPLMEGRSSAVVNIGSIAGSIHLAFQPIYAASKAALHTMSESMRLELEPLDIRVVTLIVGCVQSKVIQNIPAYRIPEGSLYQPIESQINEFVQAENRPPETKTEDFARDVVRDVVGGKDGMVWRGKWSVTMWVLWAFFPRWVQDRVASGGPGLGMLKNSRAKVKSA